jgi:hypothetical protein
MKHRRVEVRIGTVGRQRAAMRPGEESATACRGRRQLTSCIEAHFCLQRGVSVDIRDQVRPDGTATDLSWPWSGETWSLELDGDVLSPPRSCSRSATSSPWSDGLSSWAIGSKLMPA